MATPKERALALFIEHIALAPTNGTLFRTTIMNTLKEEFGVSQASAATLYNNAKKSQPPIEGLGRAPQSANAREASGNAKVEDDLQPDDECFTVLELLTHKDGMSVGRCRSHLMQGDASEDYDERVSWTPLTTWIMIKGLGPNTGDSFKLASGESEIRRYTPATTIIVEKDPILLD